jgi:selenocysteine lyase/cysteine desulfurase
VGALVFVDGSQLVGALPVAADLEHVDVMATSDHKFLMNAGRGVGYCYLSPETQDRFIPVTAGWKAGRAPFESFFGPAMDLSSTASRFDNSISWLAAIGDEAALAVFDVFGRDEIFRRNAELADLLRAALTEVGREPVDLPGPNRSTIVSVPLGDSDAAGLLAHMKQRGVVCSARDGNLRLAVHFYNHEDDVERVASVLARR